MFHIVLSIASRFMFFGNVLQGLARGILALRNLGIISSHLIPTLSPPPPILLLDAAAPFVELPEEIHSPYPSAGLIAIERIERRTPAFSSPIPSYQSSLISVTPSHLPDFLPLLITLAIISGLVVFFPGILYFFVKVVKIPSTFTHASRYISKFFGFKPISGFLPARLPLRFTSRLLVSLVSLLLLWTGPPAVASFFTFIWVMSILLSQDQGPNVIVVVLQWCGILAMQDTRTPPILNAIYEQVERAAAGYNDLVGCSDLSHAHGEEQAVTDCPVCSHLASLSTDRGRNLSDALQRENQGREAHDEQLEKHRLWVQHVYTQFVASQNGLREQLELSHAREQKLHADLLVAEQEHESLRELITTLRESNKKRRGWEVIAANARDTATKVRADLTAALDCLRDVREQLDRQTLLLSGKDHAIQSITEESQIAHVRLKNAENKLASLTTKLQFAHDLRRRRTQKLLAEQARAREHHESEMQRVTQDAQDAQELHESEMRRVTQDAQDSKEQLGILREELAITMEKLRDFFDPFTDSKLSEWSMAFRSPEAATHEYRGFRLPPPPPTKADGNLQRDHRPRPSTPRDRIPRLDYGLPVDFVPSFGGLSLTTEFNDFGCIIPLDCPTSTPVASRKRALKDGLPSSDTSPAALAVRSLSFTDLSPPFVGKGLLPSLDIFA